MPKKKTPGNRTKVLSTLKVPRSRIILNSTEEIAQYERKDYDPIIFKESHFFFQSLPSADSQFRMTYQATALSSAATILPNDNQAAAP
ncbi:hypothetical protein VTN49DRAFT_5021 [Thermomyces lanuginosus]|uniref:uncharacterized protein n=1 Tax=Thermomyces lanuginosus TaxID=5541 RepID=UPI0037423F92